MTWAILTGDIVESSRLDTTSLDQAIGDLAAIGTAVASWPGVEATAFSRRGGDGWQMAVSHPAYALRISLMAQACLRQHEISTRIAVAEGAGQLPAGPTPDLNSAHGPAFQASGRLLEALPARQLFGHATGQHHHATFLLADHIAQGWTAAQARALTLMLPPDAGPRRHAAKALGISRQAVDQALHGAGYPALIAAITAIETVAS